jgi:hypothetical protein
VRDTRSSKKDEVEDGEFSPFVFFVFVLFQLEGGILFRANMLRF